MPMAMVWRIPKARLTLPNAFRHTTAAARANVLRVAVRATQVPESLVSCAEDSGAILLLLLLFYVLFSLGTKRQILFSFFI